MLTDARRRQLDSIEAYPPEAGCGLTCINNRHITQEPRSVYSTSIVRRRRFERVMTVDERYGARVRLARPSAALRTVPIGN
jgi:hypothetical protein